MGWTRKYAELREYTKNTYTYNENSSPQLTLNSNSVGNFYLKIKVFPEAVHGYFLFKIGILWFRDIKKLFPSLIDEVPPLPLPQISIMEYKQF